MSFTALDAGDYTLSLGVPGDFAHFYHACFDTTSGSEVFLNDGDTNLLSFSLAEDASISCRWYVIPENASGQTSTPSATTGQGEADIQVFGCPVAYAGNDYLTDCDPVTDPVSVALNAGDTYDPATAVTSATGADGKTSFTGLGIGDYTMYLDVPGEFATFYYACFDTTSGSESFLFDGTVNPLQFSLGTNDASISCRWYIIPEDLRGGSPSPTTAPSSQPTTAASVSAKPSSVVALPNTGSGSGSGGSFPLTGLVVILVAVAALIASAAVVIGRRPGAAR